MCSGVGTVTHPARTRWLVDGVLMPEIMTDLQRRMTFADAGQFGAELSVSLLRTVDVEGAAPDDDAVTLLTQSSLEVEHPSGMVDAVVVAGIGHPGPGELDATIEAADPIGQMLRHVGEVGGSVGVDQIGHVAETASDDRIDLGGVAGGMVRSDQIGTDSLVLVLTHRVHTLVGVGPGIDTEERLLVAALLVAVGHGVVHPPHLALEAGLDSLQVGVADGVLHDELLAVSGDMRIDRTDQFGVVVDASVVVFARHLDGELDEAVVDGRLERRVLHQQTLQCRRADQVSAVDAAVDRHIDHGPGSIGEVGVAVRAVESRPDVVVGQRGLQVRRVGVAGDRHRQLRLDVRPLDAVHRVDRLLDGARGVDAVRDVERVHDVLRICVTGG